MARPTRLTPRVTEIICEAIETGANYADAAAAAKVSAESLEKWRAAGKEIFDRVAASSEPVALTPKEMRLFRFYGRFASAEGQGAVNCSTVVYNAAMKDPDWALRWLERRRPNDWASRVRQEISGPGGGPIETSTKAAVQIDAKDELREFLRAIADIGLTGAALDELYTTPTDAEAAALSAADEP